MPQTKKWLMVLLVANIVLLATHAYAQEPPSNIWRDLRKDPLVAKPKVTEDGGILCGYVVAFGVLLPRPYYVTLREDTIWINDIAFEPIRPNPSPPPVEPHVEYSDSANRLDSLLSEMETRVPELSKQYSEQKAHEMVLQEYQNHPLIKSLVYDDSSKIFWGESLIRGPFYVLSEKPTPSNLHLPIPTREERVAQQQVVQKWVRQMLLDGGVILIGHNFGVRAIGSDAYTIIDTVLKVKRDSVAVEEGKERILKVVHDEKMAQDIVEHLDSWPNDIH
jgi:hypothetical protein